MSLIDFFLNSYLITISILFGFSLGTRIFLKMIGQNWINTYSHSLTIFILPVVTFVITSVISSNIALSLGLVGALSIVRFRHPVRSPLELGMYFYLIGLGIAASVNIKWTIVLGTTILLLILFFHIFEILLKKKNYYLFSSSFVEGNILNTLEVKSNEFIDELTNHSCLINFEKDFGNYFYRLASSNKNELIIIFKKYEDKKFITKISFSA